MRSPRYTYKRSFFGGYFPPGVKWLLIVNVAMFVVTGLFGRMRLLELAPAAVILTLVEFLCNCCSVRASASALPDGTA